MTTIALSPVTLKAIQWLLALLIIDYVSVTIATIIDFRSGINRCRRLEIRRTSSGYRRTIDKLSRYYTTLISLTTIDAMIVATAMLLKSTSGWSIPVLPLFTTIGAIAMTLIEAKSVIENTQRKSDYTSTARSITQLLSNPDLKSLADQLRAIINNTDLPKKQ